MHTANNNKVTHLMTNKKKNCPTRAFICNVNSYKGSVRKKTAIFTLTPPLYYTKYSFCIVDCRERESNRMNLPSHDRAVFYRKTDKIKSNDVCLQN